MSRDNNLAATSPEPEPEPELEPECDEVTSETSAELREQLTRLREEFDRFTYVVSHDFNAPVRAIVNVSAWLQEELDPGALNDDIRGYLAILVDRSIRMRTMLDTLLRISRIPRTSAQPRPVEPVQLIRALIAADQGDADHTELVLAKVTGEGLRCTVDEPLFNEALSIVVDNARRHHDGDLCKLEVHVAREGEELVVRITDDGPGVPVNSIAHLRELFRTGKPCKDPNSVGGGWPILDAICQARGARASIVNRGAGPPSAVESVRNLLGSSGAQHDEGGSESSEPTSGGEQRGLEVTLRWPWQDLDAVVPLSVVDADRGSTA